MQIFSGHTNRVNDVAFSLDGSRLASCSTDGTVRIWDCLTGESEVLVEDSQDEFGCVGFVASGGLVILSLLRGPQVWDGDERSCVTDLIQDTPRMNSGFWNTFAIAPDGARVSMLDTFVSFDTRIRTWNASDWRKDAQFRLLDKVFTRGLAYDPTGTRLATSVGVFGAKTGVVHSGKGFQGDTLAWSPDRKLIAGLDNHSTTVRVYEVATGGVVRVLSLGGNEVYDFAFSHDGAHVAVVGDEETVRIWDTRTWQEEPALAWGIGKLKCIAFSLDGTRVAVGSQRGTILVWDWGG